MANKGFISKIQALLTQLNIKNTTWDFRGDQVVKNPPANGGDTDSIPGPGRFYMWSK